MKKFLAGIVVIFLLSGSFVLLGASGGKGSLPTRSECIVKIGIQWQESIRNSPEKREIVKQKISKAIALSAASDGPDVTAQQSFPRDTPDTFYLQFQKNCSNRLNTANRLMDYVKHHVNNAPELVVYDTMVEPSNDTINAWGPHWKGEPETIFPMEKSHSN